MITDYRSIHATKPNKWNLLRNFVLVAAALVLYPIGATAAPSVSGLIITVPDNGWYQFQSAADYSTLCEGVTSCTVSPGNYIVINHSNGERFENVAVSGEASADVSLSLIHI